MSLSRRTFISAAAALAMARPARAARKTPKILLRSAWQTVNIGDIAHTPGMLSLLGRHIPEAEIILWPGPLGDGVKKLLSDNFPKLKFAENAPAQKAAIEECDFFLHSSGPSLVGEPQLAQWAAKTQKPYGVMGITMSAPNEGTKKMLDGAKFLYLRDSVSKQVAKDAKVQAPIVDFTPDAAFGVTLRNDAAAEAFLRKHDLQEGQYLCFVPKFRNTPYWLIHNKPMSQADKAKDQRNQEMKESDFDKVRPALYEVLKQTKYKVLLCPEDKGHIAINKEMIYDRLPADLKPRVVFKDDYWITDEAVSVYVKSLGLLSVDMHSPIMAIGNGVPAIHCRFKEQTSKGVMWNDIGLNDWLFNLDDEKDASRITAATLKMVTDREFAKTYTEKARKFVMDQQATAFAEMKKHL